jgi:UDP-N-acetylglucosamine 3-dehydrogenase
MKMHKARKVPVANLTTDRSETQQKLKAAVIGAGLMGKNHVRVYSSLPTVELVAVADNSEKVLSSITASYRCRTYTDYREMLDTEKPDLVSVVVPTMLHKEVAMEAIKRNVHVLLEKPIAETVADGKIIIAAAKEHKVKLMIGHIERFNPAIIELKERIARGELGKVFKIDVNRVGPFPARIRDVGVVLDLAVHDLDIIRYLTGSEVQRLYAETEKQIHTSHEDLLSGLLRFKDGTICSLNINWLTPTKIRKLYITGEKGMYVADYLKQDLFFYENGESRNNINYTELLRGVTEGTMVRFAIRKKEPLVAEIEHFIDCVRSGKEPLNTGDDGLEALRLAQLLSESAKTGRAL